MENETFEKWNMISGYNGRYSVSNFGKVMNNDTNKILSQGLASHGYLTVSLCINNNARTYLVHRLVAKFFVPNPCKGTVVNHIDGNKLNNNSNNLEWCTQKHNIEHAKKILGKCPGKHKIKIKCVNTGEVFDSITSAANSKCVNRPNILSVLCGKRMTAGGYFWEYVEKDNIQKKINKNVFPVMCVETNKIYKNISEAKKETGITTIYSAIYGKTKTAGGYHWIRLDKDYFLNIEEAV